MADLVVEVPLVFKNSDLYRKRQSLQPAWLRESGETVGADRAFIWGKAQRQPHKNGSG